VTRARRRALPYDARVPTAEELRDALNTVEDPELGMGIVDLGLVYDVEVEGSTARVTQTLTSMGCPVGPYIQEQISDVARGVEGIDEVEVELVWTPPWSPDLMSEDAKFVLGF
jgi:metal-sulfur cluster biosynthetic enzyme